MGKICKDLFRNFPDFKGIKTAVLFWYLIAFKFRNFPDFKGIKTDSHCQVRRIPRLETSLTSKGLRPWGK